MTNTNVVVLVGNLTRDLSEQDFAYVGQGTARANVSIAVNRSKKQGDQWIDEANFFDITIWGKTAENLKPYLRKGQKIAVTGFLKQDRWEKDGQKHSRVSVVAESVELCGGNSNQQNTQNGFQPVNNQQPQYQQIPQPQTMQQPVAYQNSQPQPMYNSNPGFSEDIPF